MVSDSEELVGQLQFQAQLRILPMRDFEQYQTLTNFSFSNTLTDLDTKLLFILVSFISQPLTARIP